MKSGIVKADSFTKLSLTHIAHLVSEPYLSRGKKYFKDGSISLLSVKDNHVKAKALGTSFYSITLTLIQDQLDGTCSCPAFSEFGPCKHLAATGFAVMAYAVGRYKESEESKERMHEQVQFERMLSKKTKAELIELILYLAQEYPDSMYDLQD
jgi:uncharacterized Zn finger protein